MEKVGTKRIHLHKDTMIKTTVELRRGKIFILRFSRFGNAFQQRGRHISKVK